MEEKEEREREDEGGGGYDRGRLLVKSSRVKYTRVSDGPSSEQRIERNGGTRELERGKGVGWNRLFAH